MSDDIHLLPCPFCSDGGNPRWMTTGGVYCRDCGANTCPMSDDEASARMWNTRRESAELAALRRERDDALLVASAATQEGDGSGAFWVYNAVTHGPYRGEPLTDAAREALRKALGSIETPRT